MNGRPNVLFFFTDDQRFDTFYALGNDQIHTPNLDKIVATGTVFTHAHIPGGTCGAVCMPSRAMLHTGRTLFHIEREGQEIPKAHITLGECFKNAGYATFGTGKWHNAQSSFARSFSCGDEIFFGGMGDHWNVPAYRYDPEGQYDKKCPFVKNPWRSNKVEFRNCDHIEAGKHSTDLFVDASAQFLAEHDTSRPFFMYVSLMAPHDPRTMPERFLKMYAPSKIKLPENFQREHLIDTGALKIRDELLAAFPRNSKEIRRHIAEYYAMISHLDDAFGRLVDVLRETGEFKNTIIVFAGDNGLAVGQHGLMGKQNLYDHSVRVPLIFTGPGIPKGQKIDSLVYLLDVFPTICDLLDIEKPESVEGKSLSPCLRDPNYRVREALYLVYADSIRGVRNVRYKLIEYACGATQLFDLVKDPHEMSNVANKPEMATTLAELRQTMFKYREAWDDRNHPTGNRFWNARTDLK